MPNAPGRTDGCTFFQLPSRQMWKAVNSSHFFHHAERKNNDEIRCRLRSSETKFGEHPKQLPQAFRQSSGIVCLGKTVIINTMVGLGWSVIRNGINLLCRYQKTTLTTVLRTFCGVFSSFPLRDTNLFVYTWLRLVRRLSSFHPELDCTDNEMSAAIFDALYVFTLSN